LSYDARQRYGFTLPLDADIPIIMIGPGTGIAPFRAFLQERILSQNSHKNWLFFGERNKAFDYYYEDDFKNWQEKNALQIHTAFSRDQENKEYVQHLLLKNASEIFAWITEGAHIYVCGDAKKMAKDVDQALRHIIREEGKMHEEDASQYLKTLRKEKRYLLDVY
jgi:sulfite reductase (NADPH) flavoprotein alpha-component